MTTITGDKYDLNPHRQRLEELYIQEDRSLKDVMEILKQETGCQASKNMYMKKIAAWGLKKNNNRSDMVRLLKFIQQKKGHPNRPRVFQVRGKTVTEEEVLQYFKKASSTRQLTKIQASRSQLQESQGQLVQATTKIREPPILPAHYYFQERSMFAVYTAQRQMLGTIVLQIKAGTRDSISRQEAQTELRQFMADIATGARALRSDPRAGGSWLERGFRRIRSLVERADPEMMRNIMAALGLTHHHEVPQVGEMLTKHLYQVSWTLYGPDHEITRVAQLLFHNWDSFETIKLVTQICYDATADTLGKQDDLALFHMYGSLVTLRMTNPTLQEIGPKYEALIENSKSCLKLNVAATTEYGTFLANNGQYRKGLELLNGLEAFTQQDQGSELQALQMAIMARTDVGELVMQEPEFVGFVEDPTAQMNRYYRAEAIIQDAWEKMRKLCGDDHALTLAVKYKLGLFNETFGALADAQQKYDEIGKSLEEFTLTEKDGS